MCINSNQNNIWNFVNIINRNYSLSPWESVLEINLCLKVGRLVIVNAQGYLNKSGYNFSVDKITLASVPYRPTDPIHFTGLVWSPDNSEKHSLQFYLINEDRFHIIKNDSTVKYPQCRYFRFAFIYTTEDSF